MYPYNFESDEDNERFESEREGAKRPAPSTSPSPSTSPININPSFPPSRPRPTPRPRPSVPPNNQMPTFPPSNPTPTPPPVNQMPVFPPSEPIPTPPPVNQMPVFPPSEPMPTPPPVNQMPVFPPSNEKPCNEMPCVPPKNFMPAKPDEKLLDMLLEAIKDEMEDAEYCSNLCNLLTQKGDQEIVRHIRMDELKHAKLLQEIYFNLTGKKACPKINPERTSDNVALELEKSMFKVLSGIAFYRKIYFSFLNIEIRDMIYEILTDEQCHATKFSYLYAKYR